VKRFSTTTRALIFAAVVIPSLLAAGILSGKLLPGDPAPRGACSFAKIADPDSNRVQVHTAPASRHFDGPALPNGSIVYVCAERDGWFEIHFSEVQGPCDIRSPQGLPRLTAQHCMQGWVRREFISVATAATPGS
jgi:hypothetical protein